MSKSSLRKSFVDGRLLRGCPGKHAFFIPFAGSTNPCYTQNYTVTSNYCIYCPIFIFIISITIVVVELGIKGLCRVAVFNRSDVKLNPPHPPIHRSKTTRREPQMKKPTTLSSGMLEDLSAVPAVSKARELSSTIQLMVKLKDI